MEYIVMKHFFIGLASSVALFACEQRSSTSETSSLDQVTIRVKNSGVRQAVMFASVTQGGECRGGVPKYQVPKSDSDWKQGNPLPDLKVDLSVKRVCIAGQAGAAIGGGQDIKYWDLPANLKGGSTLIINGDQISLADEISELDNAELACDSFGAQLIVEKTGGKYLATVSGKAAELLRDEQGKPVKAVGGGYDAGKTFDTKKQFPKHWTLANNFDKTSEAPKVTVKDLSKNAFGYSADQYSPVIKKEENGYKLIVTFFELTGSHTTVTYEYANWFFAEKDCKISSGN
ncbi:MAG: hypothetical protein RL189_121 [Pseudomonadota bacterium]